VCFCKWSETKGTPVDLDDAEVAFALFIYAYKLPNQYQDKQQQVAG